MPRPSLPAVLALALLPGLAGAQTPDRPPAQPPAAAGQEAPTPPVQPVQPWTMTVDFGVRGSAIDGDAARYERYRDLGDGLFVETLRAGGERRGWLYAFAGDHLGRTDQRLFAQATDPGTFRGHVMWDQIPMLLSRTTETLYDGIGTGVLTIDDPLQAQVQANPIALVPIFDQFARQFEMKTRRHIAEGEAEYAPTPRLTVTVLARHTDREGVIPYGGSFGHSSLVELPAPTNYTISEFEGGAEYVKDILLLRAGYSGSWFNNEATTVAFDNPFRAVDSVGASSRGRLSMPPGNSFISVNGLAAVKLPARSRATAYVSVGSLTDAGDPIMAQTINTALSPGPLDRATVEGEARTTAVNLTFTSRPRRDLDLDVRYRTYDYDNRTPEFFLDQRVAYDNTVSTLEPPIHTEPYGVERQTFDADLRWTPFGRSSAGIGYSILAEERTFRIFESTADNVFRLTFDTLGNRWFTLRTKYEHAQRRGDGIEQGEALLREIGEQPGMRHFDLASRNRDRVTLLATVTPVNNLSGTVSVGAGKDDYLESEFGLRDNDHQVYTTGLDWIPDDRLLFGGSYAYENYNALNRSRQANPGPQFDDPSRNWAADQADRAHTVTAYAGIKQVAGKVDIDVAYDFSRARAHYTYLTGPISDRTLPEEVEVPSTLPPPEELPPVLSELQRGTADVVYALTTRVALGFSYWYEKYRVQDFTLDIDANPVLPRGQALLIGYLYRPYTANTFWGRVVVRF